MSGLAQNVTQAMEGLGLRAMAMAWRRQEEAKDRRGANPRLAEALEAERAERATKAMKRRTVVARVPQRSAFLGNQEVWYPAARRLDPAVIQLLRNLNWIQRGTSLVFFGPTGTGKSWLASGLANEALAAGRSVEVWRVPDLIAEWNRCPERVRALRRRLARLDLLVLDEWGGERLAVGHPEILRRIVTSRLDDGAPEDRRSILFTSPVDPARWSGWLGGDHIAEGLADRIIHGSQVIQLHGPSLRGRAAKEQGSA